MNLLTYLKKRIFGKKLFSRKVDYKRVRVKIIKIKNPELAYKLIDNHLAYFNGQRQPIDINKLISDTSNGMTYMPYFYDVDYFIQSMKKIGCKVEKI